MKKSLKYLPFYIVSFLPQKVIHALVGILFFIVYAMISYRKKTVFSNLRRVFKTVPISDIQRLQKKFYRQFLKNMEELIPLLTQKEETIKKSIIVENPEIFAPYLHLKKPILLTTAHTGNWEKAFSALPLFIGIPLGLVYTPVKNTFFGGLLNTIRSRFGLMLISRYHFKEHLTHQMDRSFVYIMPADQRPVQQTKSFKATFLGTETNFLFGVEKYAVQYDLPVVYMHITDEENKCMIKFSEISNKPREMERGYITKKYAALLEMQIYADPKQWLWSHRRWKDQNDLS
jgi:KDO2-lipid IV(A) lauroyltransferase